jgi:hypothetical protein
MSEPNITIQPLPGCRGDCQQGRRPCLSPEECMPDSPPLTRNGCLIAVAMVLGSWAIVFAIGYLVKGML